MVFASVNGGKVTFLVSLTDDLVEKGMHAGKMIKEIAKAAGAVIKIGRSTRYHFPTMDAYMDELRKVGAR